jgi:hypothetical protein
VVLILVGASLLAERGDPGQLFEPTVPLPDLIARPMLTDVTEQWGLADWRNTSGSELSGGVSLADLDQDGLTDLVITGGSLSLFFNDGERFVATVAEPNFVGGDASASLTVDLDRDGWVDIVVGVEAGDDVVIWGGPWAQAHDLGQAETTTVPGGNPTTGFAAADLSGNGLLDLVRLGYGGTSATEDLILSHEDPRRFVAHALPDSDRRSLAVEIADVDGDRRLDIWITRDVGWKSGGDSLYMVDGQGVWYDAAAAAGSALEIDGMGVTIGDIDLDGALDAYVSDLGDNELLVRTAGGFRTKAAHGLARIRPPGAASDVVSSSWASGLTDINLDGQLDVVVVNGGFTRSGVENKISGTSVVLNDPPAVFLGLGDGTYADVWPSAGLTWDGVYRGLGLGDLDADGDTDLVFVPRRGTLRVFRNDTPGSSVAVVARPGCDPHGSTVSVEAGGTTTLRLLAPHTFLGNHASEGIVGVVGPALVTVFWSDGTVSMADVDVGGSERVRIAVSCGEG